MNPDLEASKTCYQDYWNSHLEAFYKSGEHIQVKSKINNLTLQGVFYRAPNPLGRSPQTVLIVPGRTEGSLKYTETCYDFVQQGINVLVYGHRGQGFSERMLSNPQIGYVEKFEDYAEDLDTWHGNACKKSGVDYPHLLAHSMGALISLMWLERAPQKIASVCFTSPMMKFNFGQIPELGVRALVTLKGWLGQAKEFSVKPGELNLKTYGQDLTSCADRLAWYRALLAKHPTLQLGYPSNHWLKVALAEQSNWDESRITRLLARYAKVDFLVLEAALDTVVLPSVFRNLTGSLDNFESQIIPDAKHDIFIEKNLTRKFVTLKIFELWDKSMATQKESIHAS